MDARIQSRMKMNDEKAQPYSSTLRQLVEIIMHA